MEQGASNGTSGTKWGQHARNENAKWVKVRDMVGTPFTLLRCNAARIKGKPSYVFEASGDRLFSVNAAESALGKQIGRHGVPPAGEYEILKVTENADGTPIKNPQGFVFRLKAL